MSPPIDWSDPNWTSPQRVHNWRNHISEGVKVLWPTFTDEQKQAIAMQAEEVASAEEWD